MARQGRVAELDKLTGGLLSRLHKSGELTGEIARNYSPPRARGLEGARLLLIGAGKREQFNTATLRKVAGVALRYLKSRSVHNLVFAVREGDANEETAQAIAEGVVTADFETDKYKTDKKKDKFIDGVAIAGYGDAEKAAGEKGIARGPHHRRSAEFRARSGERAFQQAHTQDSGGQSRGHGQRSGSCGGSSGRKENRGAENGALAQRGPGQRRASAHDRDYLHPGEALKPGAPVIGLVGKAVTFDTGGISIKPADGMEKMKYDMAGGATMIGIMRALAALKPNVKVICVVPSTENMPGGKAQKPGDIQTAMSGKTIEVLNTDAEGRLILADGVHYAKQLGATHLVDAATLTGAIVVALANVNVGVFGSDQAWTDKLLASAKASGRKNVATADGR